MQFSNFHLTQLHTANVSPQNLAVGDVALCKMETLKGKQVLVLLKTSVDYLRVKNNKMIHCVRE